MSPVTHRTAALLASFIMVLPALAIGSPGSQEIDTPGWDHLHGRNLVRTLWGDYHLDELMNRIPSFPGDAESGYWIVQFDGPILNEWRMDLERSGSRILGYLPKYCYLIEIGENTLPVLSNNAHIEGTSPYPSGMKTSPEFYDYMTQGEDEWPNNWDDRLLVELFSPDIATERMLQDLSPGVVQGSGTRYLLDMPISSFEDLIRLKGVRWVEPWYEYELHNNVSKYITGTQMAWDDLGLTGKGQIVAIADTGIDTGTDNHSVDGDMIADLDNRITTSTWAGPSSSDTHSHGTHVAGSVAGNGSNSGGEIQGMAPEAEIFFQSIANQNAGNRLEVPSNLSLLFQEAYDFGARIHTNSWGSSVYGAYTSSSWDVDWFLHNNPEMIILFSAGNSGMDYYKPWGTYNPDGKIDVDSIGSPATAKNAITVGASENYRLEGGYSGYPWGIGSWLWKYSLDPIKSDLTSDDPTGMAAFSSRGPTDDGRLKPDVVAPGTNILSVRSTQTTATGWGAFAHNSNYLFMGGTSMSTPLTAGMVALIRDFYNGTLGLDKPSGALMKATLINGATDLTPGQYGTSNATIQEINRRPDNDQGWGRVNITESISPREGNLAFQDVKGGLQTGQSFETYLRVLSGAKELRMTLVWPDSPGDMAAAIKLVNDLDLIVQAPNGTIYHGNDLIHPYNDTTDRINPVEGISVSDPFVGLWKITVNGTNIPLGPQDFALVASGDISNFSGAVRLDQEYYSTDGDIISLHLYDQDLIEAGTATVNITSDTFQTGRLITLVEEGTSGMFTGSIMTSNSSTSNVSRIHVSDDDIITASYVDNDPAGYYNATAVAKKPVRIDIRYQPEYNLVFSEYEMLYLNGTMDIGIDAWWRLDGLPMVWRPLHDDGNLTFGDHAADDGNYTDLWYIPAGSSADTMLQVKVNDPFLGPRIYDHFPIIINSSLPRFPGNVSIKPLPSGNRVFIQWGPTNETDIQYHSVWVNSSSSG
ncbi:MAG: S8 family serine peptidase, partial [Thermoplasmatota archaeon]